MVSIKKKKAGRYLELGGGSSPKLHPKCMGGEDVCIDVRTCYNEQGQQTTDFTCNFEELPLPLSDNEFDGVFAHFLLEHLSYRLIPAFLKDVFRVTKPDGNVIFCVPNTKAQIDWCRGNQAGWDGKDLFNSASELFFGSQDYDANTHKAYFDPDIAKKLMEDAGFVNVKAEPYGARGTDLCVQGEKPTTVTFTVPATDEKQEAVSPNVLGTNVTQVTPQWGDLPNKVIPLTALPTIAQNTTPVDRASLFDKDYFNGGRKVGGYAGQGYADFPVHEVTFRHILARNPRSVLEIGCARGYILKRLQDVGIRACGSEISHHCHMTRACNGIIEHDICETPWPWKDKEFDLCYSVAVMEHIPEEKLPAIMREMSRVSVRGLHGIDFGEKDDGFDRTHVSLKPKHWWEGQLRHHCGVEYNTEVLNKEELESGQFPQEVYKGDGKTKVNIGSFTTMFHNGWINLDMVDLTGFAKNSNYQFVHHDARKGLPFGTGTVDMIYSSHFLEHLNYKEGLSFLRDCRRVIKPDGALRLIVPNAIELIIAFQQQDMDVFDEITYHSPDAKTQLMKLWPLLMDGHQSAYDDETLCSLLTDAGFLPKTTFFRQHGNFNERADLQLKQMLKETICTFPSHSLYVDAIPAVG